MKKVLLYIIVLLVIVFPTSIKGLINAVISGTDVRVRTGPGTNNSIYATLNINTPISLEDKTLYEGSGCSAKWYKVKYDDKDVYVCSTYVSFTSSYSGINVINYTARVNSNNVSVRKEATTSSTALDTLSLGVNVTILSTHNGSTSSCSSGNWYKINYYSNKSGYICSNYVTKKETIMNNDITSEYKEYLVSQGFPESYHPYLNYLHLKYPTWTFKGKITRDTFATAVNKEEGKNYMQTTNNNYRTSSVPAEGSSWFRINSGVISFYMDPRNWLTEERIFMFEQLNYDTAFENDYLTLTKAIFGNGALGDDKYTISMVAAGKSTGVSPVHIASRISLEVGVNGSDSTNGEPFTWKGQTYSGYYNFFNIGAYEQTINGVKYSAITRGLAHAAKLIDRPGEKWDNIETALVEGASFLANSYITKGQGTQYYQKFNVNPNSHTSNYTHQYQTNVQAPAIEGNKSYNSYKNASLLNSAFIFEIPIYKDMPAYTSLPNSGNTNNDLSSLEIEGYSLSPSFDEDIINYEAYVTKSIDKVNIKATPKEITSSVSGTGEVLLTSDNNSITVTVRAESGEEKNYIIKVYKVEDTTDTSKVLEKVDVKVNDNIITKLKNNTSSDVLQTSLTKNGAKNVIIKDKNGKVISGNNIIGTGSTVTIETALETKTFEISVNGDTSGDGIITILDLLQVQKHIKNSSKLSGSALISADTSADGDVTILDLLQVQRHIKGASLLR